MKLRLLIINNFLKMVIRYGALILKNISGSSDKYFLNLKYKMTSVLSSTRQVPLATTFYQVPANFNSFYELQPSLNGSGNYPGVMIATTLSAAPTGVIARDMGKTVKYNNSFYREVQLLAPASSTASFGGIVGMNAGSAYAPYATYYIVVPISGFGSALTLSGFVPLAGGQM